MNQILQGDSWKLANTLEDESVDCVITSPPYWGLRDYGTGYWKEVPGETCKHIMGAKGGNPTSDKFHQKERTDNETQYSKVCLNCGAVRVDLQAGLEEHPQQWVDKMVGLCELLRPKLKKSGVMFWNIGETYFSKPKSSESGGLQNESYGTKESSHGYANKGKQWCELQGSSNWLQSKQLLGLPWRFAIAMQDKGWILRNAIIWDKPNHMPSSVKDRFANGYEYVFMFVKNRKYFFDLDSVREPHTTPPSKNKGLPRTQAYSSASLGSPQQNANGGVGHDINGKNPGDVWRITTKPHPFAHFAVFPEALAEKCLKSGCPEWVCKKCGQPRIRQVKTNRDYTQIDEKEWQEYAKKKGLNPFDRKARQRAFMDLAERGENYSRETTGWTDCGCNEGFDGGLVLDPFMGSGTVGVVAQKLKRQYFGFELNPEYIKIAQNRLRNIKDWKLIKQIDEGKQKQLKVN